MPDISWRNERRKLGDLTPQPDNPRQIHKAQAERLVTSLEDFDQVETIAVSPDGEVYNGHQRLAVWQQKFGADYEIDVRVASRALTHKEWARLTVLLHRGTTGEWDFDGLANWEGVDVADLLDWGFDAEELGWADEEPAEAPEAQIDRAAELQEQWGTERGQVWEVGRHRVMCGDSTSADDVARLMGGEKAALVIADPPYGIGRDIGFGGAGGFGGSGAPIARRQYDDTWDAERPAKAFFDCIRGLAPLLVVFGGNYFTDLLPQGNHWIVWDKQNTMPTFGDCELAWTNVGRNSVKKYTVVYNGLIGKEKERFHPTQKPVELLAAIVGDYSDTGVAVIDPCCGSGTTLVACEQLGRIGYGMEIEPKYVAVTLQRLADMGLEPRLAE